MTMGPFENDPSSLAKPGANIKELKQHITMAVLQTTAMREVVMTTKHQLVPLTRGWHGPGPWSGWGGSEHGGAGAPGQGYAGTASRSGSTSATPSSTWDWLAARARMKLRLPSPARWNVFRWSTPNSGPSCNWWPGFLQRTGWAAPCYNARPPCRGSACTGSNRAATRLNPRRIPCDPPPARPEPIATGLKPCQELSIPLKHGDTVPGC